MSKTKTAEHSKWLQSIVEKIAYQQTAEDQADDCFNKMDILNESMEQYAKPYKEENEQLHKDCKELKSLGLKLREKLKDLDYRILMFKNRLLKSGFKEDEADDIISVFNSEDHDYVRVEEY